MAEAGKIVALAKAIAGSGIDPTVIEQTVADYLDAHPELITTVQDGSITEAKLASTVLAKLNLVPSLSDEIVQLTDNLDAAFAKESASASPIVKITDGADGAPIENVSVTIGSASTSARIRVTGKNILNMDEAVVAGRFRVWGGTVSANAANGSLVLAKGYWHLSVSGANSSTPPSLAMFDSDGTRIAIAYNKKNLLVNVAEKGAIRVVVEIPSDANWADNNVQLEYGGAQTDFEPYVGGTYVITYPESVGSISAGTLTIEADGTGNLVTDGVSYNVSASEPIKTCLGLNYIWCDIGNLSAVYRADPTLYIADNTAVTPSDMESNWNIFNPAVALPWFITNNNHATSQHIPIAGDTTYTLSYTPTGYETYGGLLHIEEYDESGAQINDTSFGYYSGAKTFITNATTKYIVLRNVPTKGTPSAPTDYAPSNVSIVKGQNPNNIYEPYALHVGVSKLPSMPYTAFLPRDNGYVQSVAHRGLSYYFPGNTEQAIVGAAKYGFNTVEIDIQFSSDGVPVLVHESTLSVVTGGALTGAPSDYIYEQLTAPGIEWGTWFDKSMTGIALCSFDHAVELCYKLNLHILMDIKTLRTGHELEDFGTIDTILAKYNMRENAVWMFGSSLIFSTGLDIKRAAFATGSALPEGWCASVHGQMETAGFTGEYTVVQDMNAATLAEANEVRSYGWHYALYTANTVEDMETCLDDFGIISEIESDRFTVTEAMARRYGIGWTDIPHNLQ